MKPGRFYKWGLLALLSGAFFFHQADRAIFGLLTVPIQKELGLSSLQIGWINTALSWTLAGMAFVAGPLADRLSRKWLITGSLIAWSLMTFLMGFAADWTVCGCVIPAFLVVMFFRSFATGVGESFYGPCYPPLIATYHKRTRSIALSLHQAALYVGLVSSGVLTARLLGVLGTWRGVFMAFGAAGCLLGVSFVWLLKDAAPASASDVLPRRASAFAGFGRFFRTPTAVLAMVGFMAIVFVNNAYLFWAPKFMHEKFGTSVGAAGEQTMFYHHLFAFAAIMGGGVLTDCLVKRLPRVRLGLQTLALLAGAPCLVAVGYVPSAGAMIVMTSLYGVFRGLFEVNTHATLFDVIPPEFRSTAVGIFTVFAFFMGGLSGVLMGYLAERHGTAGFEIGFALMGGVYLAAAACLAVAFFKTFARDRLVER